MEYLFSYGTFQHPLVQEKLFHRQVKMTKVTLDNHALYLCSDGFFSMAYKEGRSINGSLLELTKKELQIADLWELVPDLYQRTKVDFTVQNQSITAWIYERFEYGQTLVEQSYVNNCRLSDEDLEQELNLFLVEYADRL